MAALICFMVESSASGRRMPSSWNAMPTTVPRIRGFLKTSMMMPRAFGLLPLNSSSVITAMALNIGTTTEMSTTTEPASAPGTRAVASGRPIMTKFER